MPPAPLDVVYIAGAGRSGTTLLDRLLGSSPGAHSCGELNRLWDVIDLPDRLCSCGKHPRVCEFWVAVIEKAFGKVSPELAAHFNDLYRYLAPIRSIYRFWGAGRSGRLSAICVSIRTCSRGSTQRWLACQAPGPS